MWNFLRVKKSKEKEAAEQQHQDAKNRREQKRMQYTSSGESSPNHGGQNTANRIQLVKKQFDEDATALMALDLMEEELTEAIIQRRGVMLRKIQEILSE